MLLAIAGSMADTDIRELQKERTKIGICDTEDDVQRARLDVSECILLKTRNLDGNTLQFTPLRRPKLLHFCVERKSEGAK
jgi:hypothetical protein